MISTGLKLFVRECVVINSLKPYIFMESTNKSKAILSHLLYSQSVTRMFTLPADVAVGGQDAGVSESPLALSIRDSLQIFGLDEKEVKKIIENQPALLNYTRSNWVDVIKLLIDSNFPNNSIYKMLEKYPELLSIKTSNIHKGLMSWFGSGMSQNLYIEVLTTHPSFLKLDHNLVAKRIKQFQLQLESKDRAGKLFLIAPSTMTQSMERILEKINYLDELCKDKSDLVVSGVLNYDLFHIMARHEFLIRAGLYKRPTKNYDKRLDKNPSLAKIVHTTDNEFVKTLTPLSLFEYEVFLEMYKKELDSDSENNSDSDNEENHKYSYTMHKPKQKKNRDKY